MPLHCKKHTPPHLARLFAQWNLWQRLKPEKGYVEELSWNKWVPRYLHPLVRTIPINHIMTIISDDYLLISQILEQPRRVAIVEPLLIARQFLPFKTFR